MNIINAMLVGQVSCGKTSFLNGLVGMQLGVSSLDRQTVVPTKFNLSTSGKFSQDMHKITLSLNEQKIQNAVLFDNLSTKLEIDQSHASFILPSIVDMQITDYAGIGDVRDKTGVFLDVVLKSIKAHNLIIFVCDAYKPFIQQDEVAQLGKIKAEIARQCNEFANYIELIIIVNKTDDKDDEELQNVFKNIAGVTGVKNDHIFRVSSYLMFMKSSQRNGIMYIPSCQANECKNMLKKLYGKYCNTDFAVDKVILYEDFNKNELRETGDWDNFVAWTSKFATTLPAAIFNIKSTMCNTLLNKLIHYNDYVNFSPLERIYVCTQSIFARTYICAHDTYFGDCEDDLGLVKFCRGDLYVVNARGKLKYIALVDSFTIHAANSEVFDVLELFKGGVLTKDLKLAIFKKIMLEKHAITESVLDSVFDIVSDFIYRNNGCSLGGSSINYNYWLNYIDDENIGFDRYRPEITCNSLIKALKTKEFKRNAIEIFLELEHIKPADESARKIILETRIKLGSQTGEYQERIDKYIVTEDIRVKNIVEQVKKRKVSLDAIIIDFHNLMDKFDINDKWYINRLFNIVSSHYHAYRNIILPHICKHLTAEQQYIIFEKEHETRIKYDKCESLLDKIQHDIEIYHTRYAVLIKLKIQGKLDIVLSKLFSNLARDNINTVINFGCYRPITQCVERDMFDKNILGLTDKESEFINKF